jgi:hypothetical protein
MTLLIRDAQYPKSGYNYKRRACDDLGAAVGSGVDGGLANDSVPLTLALPRSIQRNRIFMGFSGQGRVHQARDAQSFPLEAVPRYSESIPHFPERME